MSDTKQESFVTASEIAVELDAVRSISTELHLSTLNAKVVTARSGEVGKAFKPLTDYANDLANTTGTIVGDISHIALRLTKESVVLMQSRQKEASFNLAVIKHGEENASVVQIKDLNLKLHLETENIINDYFSTIKLMLMNIDDLAQDVKSIFYLGMNCRIEASRCNGFSRDFEAIADDMEQAAERVRFIVDSCQTRIEKQLK